MTRFPGLIIWFLILSFSGQHHSYTFIKFSVNFSYYLARALISIQIDLPQSNVQDSRIQYRLSKPASAPHHSLPPQSHPLPRGLLVTSHRKPARFNQLSRLLRFSTRHRNPNPERCVLYHGTQEARNEVGLKDSVCFRVSTMVEISSTMVL